MNQWSSNAVSKSFAITRAVFRATLNPADIWALVGGGFFVPVSDQLVLVMLPSSGPTFQTPVTAGLAAAPGRAGILLSRRPFRNRRRSC